VAETLADVVRRRAEHLVAGGAERERVSAAVVVLSRSADPARVLEPADELRNGCARDSRAPGELRRSHRLGRDRTEGEELAERQGRLVVREEALDPAGGERGRSDERVGGVCWFARARYG
jgi:hypothetical protein